MKRSPPVAWRTGPAIALAVLTTLTGALVVICRGSARADSAGTDRLVRWWARICLRATGARIAVRGLEYVQPGTSYVVVSNHESSLDPIAALGLLPLSLRALSMREMFQIRLLGRALHLIGMIEVDRDAPDLRQIAAASAGSLAAGHSLLIYPEGRISLDGAVAEFKAGAFVMAVDSQVPILPVAVHGTRRIWGPESFAIRGGPLRLTIGPPLPTSGLTRRDVGALRDQAREFILSAHHELAESSVFRR